MPASLDRPDLSRLRPTHVLIGARLAWSMLVARLLLAGPGFYTARRVLGLRTVEPVGRARGAFERLGPRAGHSIAIAVRMLELPVFRGASCLPRSIVLE